MIMGDKDKSVLVGRLKDFANKLVKYKNMAAKMVNKGYTDKEWQDFQALRYELQESLGGLEDKIKDYVEPTPVIRSGREINAFTVSLALAEPNSDALFALDLVTHTVRKAIGKIELEGEVASKERDASLKKLPKAFIAHGDKSIALDKLCSFLKALGVEALVVEEQPSKSKAVDDKVEHYMSEADCAIILATGNDEIKGKLYPRQNVIHEIGLAQKTFSDRIIYLLEKGTEFPSNIRPKVWESFTKDCMDEAFIAVARELRAFGLMRATKE